MITTQYRVIIQPKNAKIPDVASRSLEALARAAQQQYINAIFVNGVDSIVYIKRENGRPCTCRDITIDPVFKEGSNVLTEEGTLGRATLDSLLTGNDIVFRDSGGRSGDTSVDRHKWGNQDTVVFQVEMEPRTSAPIEDKPPPTSENVNVLPSGSGNCALCFGTGYAGGFNIHQGYRETLDVTLDPELSKFSLDHTQNPHRLWTREAGAQATFTLVLPRAAVVSQSLKVFDNDKQLHSSTYLLQVYQDGIWHTLTQSNLLNFCTGKEIKIRITSIPSSFRFSHVEIQLGYSSIPVKVDIPKFDEVLHNAVFEGIVGSVLILPPTLGKLNKMSLVRESLFGRIWRITNVRDWYDHNMNNHGYETTARLIQKYETVNLLPVMSSKLVKPAQVTPSLYVPYARKFL